jgi:toxin FitB
VSIIVLDTDVASASLRNRLPDQLRARLAGQTMAITFVTVGELAKWRALRSWGPQRIAGLARWREHVAVLQYDEAVAASWGQLQARAQLRGRPRPHNDTWIARDAEHQGLRRARRPDPHLTPHPRLPVPSTPLPSERATQHSPQAARGARQSSRSVTRPSRSPRTYGSLCTRTLRQSGSPGAFNNRRYGAVPSQNRVKRRVSRSGGSVTRGDAEFSMHSFEHGFRLAAYRWRRAVATT